MRVLVVLDSYFAYKQGFVSANYLRDQGTVLRSIVGELSALGVDPLRCPKSTLESWAKTKAARLKPATVAAYVFSFKSFLAWARKRDRTILNPKIELPRLRRPFRRKFVDAPTIKILIDECPNPVLKFVLYAGFHAGLRKAEIANSKPSWFDLDRHTVSVLRCENFDTKDGEDRTIPLTKDFEAFVRVYRPAGEHMISGYRKTDGKRYRYDFRKPYRLYMDAQAERLGLGHITVHDMRRSFASVLISSRKCTVYEVAKWLGNGVEVVERHYGHLVAHDGAISLAFA